MRVDELDYTLPPELIAQQPMEPRDASRLLVIGRDGGQLEHRAFRDLPRYLRPGDLLVANDSRVLPARLSGRKEGSGGRVEALLLAREGADVWQALLKPSRRLRAGTAMVFGHGDGLAVRAEVLDGHGQGVWRVRFSASGADLDRALEMLGVVPLPPYIRHPLVDAERYQTVYAAARGSVASPTAGLHFTPGLLAQLEDQGVEVAYITCHIGLHTFRPIQADTVEGHDIHSEFALLSDAVAVRCNQARARGGRVVVVGTSSVRTLEAAWREGRVAPFASWTSLYIYPGYAYKAVDAMITNFHLPRTTLLALVSAFASRDVILEAYAEAIRKRYRFYSFGDACLIL